MLFKNQNFYPIIKTDKFEKTVQFYADFFDFYPAYEDNGFTVLQREGVCKQYLGVLANSQKSDEDSVLLNKNATDGTILNFSVENIRLAYQQFHWMEADLISDIDMDRCGQKFLAIRDPNGNILTVTEMVKAKSDLAHNQNDAYATADNNYNTN